MSVQRIPDRLVAVNITEGETFSWKRNGVAIFSVTDSTPLTFSSVENLSPVRLEPSTKPTSVFTGDLWVSSATGLPRLYDSRNKFLGLDRSIYAFKREQFGAIKLGVNLEPTYRNLNAVTLVGYNLTRNEPSLELNVDVFVDGVSILSLTLNDTEENINSNVLDIDIPPGSLIEARTLPSSTNTSSQVYLDLYYRETE